MHHINAKQLIILMALFSFGCSTDESKKDGIEPKAEKKEVSRASLLPSKALIGHWKYVPGSGDITNDVGQKFGYPNVLAPELFISETMSPTRPSCLSKWESGDLSRDTLVINGENINTRELEIGMVLQGSKFTDGKTDWRFQIREDGLRFSVYGRFMGFRGRCGVYDFVDDAQDL